MKERRNAEQLANALVRSCHTKQQKARLWLALYLASGPKLAESVLIRARNFGFSETTIRRASQGLVIRHHDPVYGGQWRWELLLPMQTVGMSLFREWTTTKLLELME